MQMDIRDRLKRTIKAKNYSFREVAERAGWSPQNIFIKLNRVSPNFDTVVGIISAIGMQIKIEKDKDQAAEEKDINEIIKTLKGKQISYDVVEQLVNTLGYQLILYDENPDIRRIANER